jgi:hypothetical protein
MAKLLLACRNSHSLYFYYAFSFQSLIAAKSGPFAAFAAAKPLGPPSWVQDLITAKNAAAAEEAAAAEAALLAQYAAAAAPAPAEA